MSLLRVVVRVLSSFGCHGSCHRKFQSSLSLLFDGVDGVDVVVVCAGGTVAVVVVSVGVDVCCQLWYPIRLGIDLDVGLRHSRERKEMWIWAAESLRGEVEWTVDWWVGLDW